MFLTSKKSCTSCPNLFYITSTENQSKNMFSHVRVHWTGFFHPRPCPWSMVIHFGRWVFVFMTWTSCVLGILKLKCLFGGDDVEFYKLADFKSEIAISFRFPIFKTHIKQIGRWLPRLLVFPYFEDEIKELKDDEDLHFIISNWKILSITTDASLRIDLNMCFLDNHQIYLESDAAWYLL